MIQFFYFSPQKKYICSSSSFNKFFLNSFLFSGILFLVSCSPSERFSKKVETTTTTVEATSEVRILLNEIKQSEIVIVDSPVNLSGGSNSTVLLDEGTRIACSADDSNINLNISGKRYVASKFLLSPVVNEEKLKLNGKMYRGKIQISNSENSIHLINIVSLEDYVKGVLAREMPSGNNNENFQALEALAVCIRTYAIKKMQAGKIYFDLFADTRDQVYGGVDAESILSNKAVDQTKNLVLKFEDNIALVYYHSTCGGYTESSENVFTKDPMPYLKTIKDGNEPYCKISPRYQWKEIYTKEEIVERLKDYSLLDDGNYTLLEFSIINRFKSGRVSELEIKVTDSNYNEKTLLLKGNEIRTILRTSDNKGILWSTMFDVSMNSTEISLTGKGYGHGVGLCQWGAIAMSRQGINYKDILQHYYPGTTISKFND